MSDDVDSILSARRDAEVSREQAFKFSAQVVTLTALLDRTREALRKASAALIAVKTDRPTAHTDAVWSQVNQAIVDIDDALVEGSTPPEEVNGGGLPSPRESQTTRLGDSTSAPRSTSPQDVMCSLCGQVHAHAGLCSGPRPPEPVVVDREGSE